MKKILIYMDSMDGGGAERTVLNLVNTINKSDFEIHLALGFDHNNDYLNLINNDVIIHFFSENRYRNVIKKLSKLIKSLEPSILFSTVFTNNIILSLSKILAFSKVPLILREANTRGSSDTLTFKDKVITYFIYNFLAKKVVAISEGVKNDLVKTFKIQKKKIIIIYNPINTEGIREMLSHSHVSKDELMNSNSIKILSVGKLTAQKSFDTLLKAFKIVSNQMDSELFIIGKGHMLNDLQKQAVNLNIKDKVHFLGFQENPYYFMHKADIFVLTSKWEGFGHVIAEAMVCGVPVVSTNCLSGPAEILQNGKFGLLSPVGDVDSISNNILKLAKDMKLRKYYSDIAKSRAADFDLAKIIPVYVELFNSLSRR